MNQAETRDGRILWLSTNGAPVLDTNGDLLGYRGSDSDITERKRAEEEQIFFSSLYQQMLEGVSLVRAADCIIVSTNPAFDEMFGYAPGELLGKHVSIVNAPTDKTPKETANEIMTDLKQKGRWVGEVQNRKKDGTPFWCQAIVSSYEHPRHGAVWLSTHRDITERKRAEAELQWRTALLEAQVGATIDGILIVDDKGNKLLQNQRCIDLWKIPKHIADNNDDKQQLEFVKNRTVDPEAFVEKAIYLYTHPNETSHDEVKFKDGMILDRYSAPVIGIDGTHFGRIWVFRDITERKLAEAALRAISSRHEAILSAVPDIIMQVDANKVYTWANPAGLTFYGKDVIGREAAFYFEGEQETYEMVKPLFQGYQDVIYVESWQRRQDGEKRLLAWWCRGFKDERGHVTGALSTARDITEQKREEAKRAALEEQLRQAQKMESVGQLAGGIAHDFNNILTGIGGYVELALQLPDAGAPMREDLAVVQRLTKRAVGLTQQLLAFSRRQTLEPQVLNLNDVVVNVVKMLRPFLGEGIDLQFAPAKDLGNVRADLGQMEQILMNLAVNSRDAMPTGGKLTIETANVELDVEYASRHADVTPGPYVMLSVSDTGQGMDAATKAHIFEPFFTTKEKGKGTGLGLATVYGIVKQHGGNIWFYSNPGKGASFKVYLPTVEEAAVAVRPPAPPQATRGDETILIVEDEASVRAIAERSLTARGYTVVTAGNAEEAVRLFSEHPARIALLLTDVILPGMNGRKLYELLKSKAPDLKVLYTSGYSDNAILHQGVLDAGVAFMQKPFAVETVPLKVRQVLDS